MGTAAISNQKPSVHNIQYGETLSGIARANKTTVSALMKANPQIKDANKIYAGKPLNIPGRTDSFEAAKPSRPGGAGRPSTPSTQAPSTTGPASQGPKGSPFDIAKSHLGKNAGSLKMEKNGVGSDMEDWVPNNVNCANFVSACLEQAGQIKNSQHHNAVTGLQANLDKDPNFKRVSLAQAKPGDVVSMKTPGGHHVVMFAGMKNGKPQFIGSNNVNADGSQRISLSSMNYPIMSIHQYRG
ncbi:C40 family peptidase [Stigmatella aurantiaca]|uniref:LysM domain protein, Peptidoglycan-binding protein n=2 Tax=Stigmatella aurantiaca (strain DW4/3-1) TaxID=378806 RepID=E3FDP5_STIAD|nr:LysM peptidoglycan-binding domain-containing protein [Stigmatella aurantiaca]ADO70124.1 LysM domain protein, Peptidoglycan-binding protein [Stigmatella aurantiaca DW4/3-1]